MVVVFFLSSKFRIVFVMLKTIFSLFKGHAHSRAALKVPNKAAPREPRNLGVCYTDTAKNVLAFVAVCQLYNDFSFRPEPMTK